MDLYVSQVSGKQDHGLFFTDENVKVTTGSSDIQGKYTRVNDA